MRKPRASVRIGFGARGIYIIRKATLEQILFLKWHICLTTVEDLMITLQKFWQTEIF